MKGQGDTNDSQQVAEELAWVGGYTGNTAFQNIKQDSKIRPI